MTSGEYVLGRSLDSDIVLEGSGVSRHHCRLTRGDMEWQVEDLDSRNGIFLNGRKIGNGVLQHGDRLQIGGCRLLYQSESSLSSRPSASLTPSIEENYDQFISQIASSTSSGEKYGDRRETTLLGEKERRQLRLFLDLANALAGEHSADDVCRKAARMLLQSTEAERTVIFLLEDDQETITPIAACERNPREAGSPPVVLSQTIAKNILKERKGIVSSDAAVDERFAHGESVVASGLRSVACTPVLGRGGVLGILYMENRTEAAAFTHDDLVLLCAVASEIGLAIENARFLEALEKTNLNLERLVEERTAELAETQLKLYQTEKIASLSRLVAGIAHEINNPLGVLKSNLDLLGCMAHRITTDTSGLREKDELMQNLQALSQTSVEACTRILSVIRALSSFSHLDQAAYMPADINDGIQTVVRLLDPAIRRNAKISLQLGDIPAIPCYPALLNEALMNLMVNACQAIKESGEIILQTRREQGDVVISVQDTGCGIPQEHLKTIFDPGFTTRGVGVGTGLGLAVAHRVIQEHKGSIGVESVKDRGCVFTIRLPVHPSEVANADPGGES